MRGQSVSTKLQVQRCSCNRVAVAMVIALCLAAAAVTVVPYSDAASESTPDESALLRYSAETPATPTPEISSTESTRIQAGSLLSTWGGQRVDSSCKSAASVRVIMADSRPLDAVAPSDSPPSLAAAINAAYAARHGYGFSYYRVAPTVETAESAGGHPQFGGRKADVCTRVAALGGAERRTPWSKLLVLWAVIQEEESRASCPADTLLFIDSDAFVTPDAGQALSLEAWLAATAVLQPSQAVYEPPRPVGGFTPWTEPPGWAPPAARLLFAANAPWWPQGPTTGTFAIQGASQPAGRATAAALLATWWDAPHTILPTAYATLASVPGDYNWNVQHPYEQTPAMIAVDAAGAAALYALDAAAAAAAIAREPLLALARHMRILDTETFRETPGQFVRHASSFDPGARLAILRAAAARMGLEGDALAAAVAALPVVDFDAFAADARLRDDFLRMTAHLDVVALLANASVVPKLR